MPDKKGFDALTTIFTQNPTQAIIILSDVGNTEDVIRAMRLGVSDYLFKPLDDMEMLSISIERARNRSRLIEENTRYRKNLEEINRELAVVVSGLPNITPIFIRIWLINTNRLTASARRTDSFWL